MTNQKTFQRDLNEERQKAVAARLTRTRADGTYSVGPALDSMVIAFTAHLDTFSAKSRSDHKINKMITSLTAKLQDPENSEVWISKKTSITSVLSLIVTEYVTARLMCGVHRHAAITEIATMYDLELEWVQLLLEEFAVVFSDKVVRFVENETGVFKVVVFRASESFAEELDMLDERIILNQKSLWPMTEKPQDWTGYIGSPYGDPLLRRRMIRKAYRNDINVDEACKVLNALQASSFKINNTVLKFAQLAYKDNDLDVFKSKRHDTWESRKSVRGAITSTRREIRQTFKAASFFAEAEKDMYIPYCIDYRGRAYPLNSVLSSQGSELEKALFRASTPVALGENGARELLIQLETTFGSKDTLENRIAVSMEKLESGELDQWLSGESKGWQKADEPFLALATAEALIGWKASGYSTEYKSDVLVFIDASNSGFQLVAGMLKDKKLGPLVNLIPSDNVGDLYAEVAQEINSVYDGPLKPYILNRKVWKRPVMCLLYSLTFIGAWNYIDDALDSCVFITEPTRLDNNGHVTKEWLFWDSRAQSKEGRVSLSIQEYREELTVLTRLFFNHAMPAVAPQGSQVLAVIQGWCKKLTKVDSVMKSGTISWTAPGGIRVHQKKQQIKKQVIKSTLSTKARVVHVITTTTNKIAPKEHLSSIVPNMIHSIDASLLWGIAKDVAAAGFTQAPCHDCFSAPAGQASELGRIVRENFIKLSEANPLQQIKEELEASYGISLDSDKEIEMLPPVGSLDLAQILNTDHSFR